MVPVAEQKASNVPLRLEAFPFPQDIEGCSCYLAVNRNEFLVQNYIYAADFEHRAYLKISGKLERFNYAAPFRLNNDRRLKVSLKNENFEVEIIGTAVGDAQYESQLYSGTITVKDKCGRILQQPFYGECGC